MNMHRLIQKTIRVITCTLLFLFLMAAVAVYSYAAGGPYA